MGGRVALIYGGRGFEHQVSLAGADFVLPLILENTYDCVPVFIAKDGRWLTCFDGKSFTRADRAAKVENIKLCAPINLGGKGALLVGGEPVHVDCAFPLLHGDFGEDGSIQGALETAAIPYVGENVFVSAFCLDKVACRALADMLGIRGTKYFSIPKGTNAKTAQNIAEAKLIYPMFIKPRALGSSVGAGKIKDKNAFFEAFDIASADSTRSVIIEECLDIACELEIGVLRQKGKITFTKIGKIESESGFYDYDEKYSGKSAVKIDSSPQICKNIEKELRRSAEKLAKVLEICSLSRIDFFLSKAGELYFNEINTMPGFTGGSLYPTLCGKSGISPRELVKSLICEALL